MTSSSQKLEVGKRIATLREINKYSQSELALAVSELIHRPTVLTIGAVSSWETGRRSPSPDVVEALSKIFNVSKYYIMCLSDDENATKADDGSTKLVENLGSITTEPIQPQSLFLYDSKPLFLTFKDHKHVDQWAIYDADKEAFITKSFVIKATSSSISGIHTFSPYISELSGKPIGMNRMYRCEKVYVKMITTDEQIAKLYDGWYSHNETHDCLINRLGLTLPYEGLDISYHAYSYKL